MMLSGIDIVHNKRIEKLLRNSSYAVNDIFSKNEIDYCLGKKKSHESFAVRFAAKESLLKAIGSAILDHDLTKIEVVVEATGKPFMNIRDGEVTEKIKEILDKDEYRISISLSHDGEYSIAAVIIY